MDVAGELEALGFRVADATVYRMVAAASLSEDVQEQIGSGEIEAVMLMSPQTAATWARLVVRHRLQSSVRRLVHLCLSEAVAKALKTIPNVRTEVAGEPSVEEMLALLDLAAAQSEEQ